ncbi:WD-40 repeat protein, partial [Reticulomyxa filosa]
LIETFTGHTNVVRSIDYASLNGEQYLCSGSKDKTVCVWNVKTRQLLKCFQGHSTRVYCAKFSPYHYYNHHRSVICSSSGDKIIRFWDFDIDKEFQTLNGHNKGIIPLQFSRFSGGRYLCSGSFDKKIRLWDVETSKSLHVFKGHENTVWCLDISSLQSNSNDKSNNVGVIGGNGYTICSGSNDKTIRIWDIETTKQFNVFKGHTDYVMSVKYGSNELLNTILSGSHDKSVRLWDIRTSKQTHVFKEHTNAVYCVEYLPFRNNNINNILNSNVICSGSEDNTIRFWDIRITRKFYEVKGDEEDRGIRCIEFVALKNGERNFNHFSKILSFFNQNETKVNILCEIKKECSKF